MILNNFRVVGAKINPSDESKDRMEFGYPGNMTPTAAMTVTAMKIRQNYLSWNDHIGHKSIGLLQYGCSCIKLGCNACQGVRASYLVI